MPMLKKEEAMYETKNGELVPQKVELWGSKERGEKKEIKIKPLIKSEIQSLLDRSNSSGELEEDQGKKMISSHVVKPDIKEKDLEYMRPEILDAISKTILINSGVPERALTFGFTKDGSNITGLKDGNRTETEETEESEEEKE